MVSNSNDNTNFPHELWLTNRQVANIRKAFANHSSIDIKTKSSIKNSKNSIIKNDKIRRIFRKFIR